MSTQLRAMTLDLCLCGVSGPYFFIPDLSGSPRNGSLNHDYTVEHEPTVADPWSGFASCYQYRPGYSLRDTLPVPRMGGVDNTCETQVSPRRKTRRNNNENNIHTQKIADTSFPVWRFPLRRTKPRNGARKVPEFSSEDFRWLRGNCCDTQN